MFNYHGYSGPCPKPPLKAVTDCSSRRTDDDTLNAFSKQQALAKLIAAADGLKSGLRLNHYGCEDGFYSCPMHEDYLGEENQTQCDCGAVKNQERVTAYDTARAEWERAK